MNRQEILKKLFIPHLKAISKCFITSEKASTLSMLFIVRAGRELILFFHNRIHIFATEDFTLKIDFFKKNIG